MTRETMIITLKVYRSKTGKIGNENKGHGRRL